MSQTTYTQAQLVSVRRKLVGEIDQMEKRLAEKRAQLTAFDMMISCLPELAGGKAVEAEKPKQSESKPAQGFRTVGEAVEFAVSRLPESFTSWDIRSVLTAHAPSWMAQRDPSSFSSAVAQLEAAGKLVLIQKGSGKRPGVYSRKL